MTPWTVAYQAPPSMGFSRQECWSGLPFPSPGDLPDPGNKPGSPALCADALPSEPPGKPILTKEARIYNGAKTASSINGAGENWTATCKRMKLEHFLIPYTKINLKWIKDLNVRPETVKLLEENIDRTVNDINQSKILYDPPPRVTEIKTKGSKWDLIKLKAFAQQRKL